jgi:hypothetical protein
LPGNRVRPEVAGPAVNLTGQSSFSCRSKDGSPVAALLRRPGDDTSVPEMPRTGKHHGDAGIVGGLDDFIVAH